MLFRSGGLHYPGDHNTPPAQRAPLPEKMAYALVCGTSDFNRAELAEAAEKLRAARRPVKMIVFNGGHALPPPRELETAVAWLNGLAAAQGAAGGMKGK